MSKSTKSTKYDAMQDVKRPGTKLFQIAQILGDKRRTNGVSRKELVERLDFDPSPYLTMYDCFQRVSRGVYTYVGETLPDVKQAARKAA